VEHLKDASLGYVTALLINIRLVCKGLIGTNTLGDYEIADIKVS